MASSEDQSKWHTVIVDYETDGMAVIITQIVANNRETGLALPPGVHVGATYRRDELLAKFTSAGWDVGEYAPVDPKYGKGVGFSKKVS